MLSLRSARDRDVVGLTLLLGIALAVRLWDLAGLPPGVSHDEAYDALNALEIARGARPVFFESNNGREPLFIYLTAMTFGIAGLGPAQLRLLPAIAGTAAVGVTWLLGRRWFGAVAGWSGAALMAVSFWPIFDSRVGLRASLIPVLVALLAYALWRWGSSGQIRWAATAAVPLGLALDTYTVARFLPALPVALGLHLVVREQVPRRRVAAGIVAMALVVAIVTAPLIAYFIASPASFGGRSGQVNDLRFILDGLDFRPLLQDSWNTLLMFTVSGDPYMRYNLADRAVFDPVSGFLFYLGLVVAWRARASVGAMVALTGLLVGALPSAITGESPHFLRAIGAQPFVFVLAGAGASRVDARWAGRAVVVSLLVLAGSLSLRDYFWVWPSERGTREIYGAPMAQLARALDGEPAAQVSFVSAEYPLDLDRFALYVTRGGRPATVTWFDGRLAMPMRPGVEATYYVASSARPPVEMLRNLLGVEPDGSDLQTVRRVAPGGLTPGRALGALVGDHLELIGYDVQSAVVGGEEARAILYWRILGRPAEDLSFFVHLIGGMGSLWGQLDGLGYPTEGWRAGDLLIQWHDIRLPVGAPPLDYAVEAGAYRRVDGARLPVRTAGGAAADDRLRLGSIRVERSIGSPGLPEGVARAAIPFGREVALRGVELDATGARPGGVVRATLYWSALAPVPADYTVFVHLVADAPQPVAQGDGPPAYGAYPTTRWPVGDLVRDPHELRLPADLAARRYWLLAGLYRASDGVRLAPIGTAGPLDRVGAWLERRTPYRLGPRVDGDRVVLGPIDVRAR